MRGPTKRTLIIGSKRYYFVSLDFIKRQAYRSAEQLRKHLARYGFPHGVRVLERMHPHPNYRGTKYYEIYSTATTSQILKLQDIMNRE